jgi:hypothetical protein
MLHTFVRYVSTAIDGSLSRRPAHRRASAADGVSPHESGGADTQGVRVQVWKDAWAAGARARWTGVAFDRNPHELKAPSAAAWSAGWRWAEHQPDRRRAEVVRFAHPYRRSTDTPTRVIRSARAGAVGLSVLTLAGWLWQIRRKRKSGAPGTH